MTESSTSIRRAAKGRTMGQGFGPKVKVLGGWVGASRPGGSRIQARGSGAQRPGWVLEVSGQGLRRCWGFGSSPGPWVLVAWVGGNVQSQVSGTWKGTWVQRGRGSTRTEYAATCADSQCWHARTIREARTQRPSNKCSAAPRTLATGPQRPSWPTHTCATTPRRPSNPRRGGRPCRASRRPLRLGPKTRNI